MVERADTPEREAFIENELLRSGDYHVSASTIEAYALSGSVEHFNSLLKLFRTSSDSYVRMECAKNIIRFGDLKIIALILSELGPDMPDLIARQLEYPLSLREGPEIEQFFRDRFSEKNLELSKGRDHVFAARYLLERPSVINNQALKRAIDSELQSGWSWPLPRVVGLAIESGELQMATYAVSALQGQRTLYKEGELSLGFAFRYGSKFFALQEIFYSSKGREQRFLADRAMAYADLGTAHVSLGILLRLINRGGLEGLRTVISLAEKSGEPIGSHALRVLSTSENLQAKAAVDRIKNKPR